MCKQASNCLADLSGLEGFADDVIRSNLPGDIEEVCAIPTGHRHDAEARKPLSDLSNCLDAFLIGHDKVCYQEIHVLSAYVIYCLFSIGSFQYVVPGTSQHTAQKFSDACVIIRDDDAPLTRGGCILQDRLVACGRRANRL